MSDWDAGPPTTSTIIRATGSTTPRRRRASRKPRRSCFGRGPRRSSSIMGGSGTSRCRCCGRVRLPTASLCDPLRLQRGRDAAYRTAGSAVHDERAVERGDAAADGSVSQHAARTGFGRCGGGAQRRAVLGMAQRVRGGDGCGGGAIAIPAFEAMHEHRTAMRRRVYEEQGVSIVPMPAPGAAPAARLVIEHSLIYGSPATVAEALARSMQSVSAA